MRCLCAHQLAQRLLQSAYLYRLASLLQYWSGATSVESAHSWGQGEKGVHDARAGSCASFKNMMRALVGEGISAGSLSGGWTPPSAAAQRCCHLRTSACWMPAPYLATHSTRASELYWTLAPAAAAQAAKGLASFPSRYSRKGCLILRLLAPGNPLPRQRRLRWCLPQCEGSRGSMPWGLPSGQRAAPACCAT